ncbi:xanthine dehydrogenase family protein molybdopterin-binding subunit [Roseomonas sp. NAR14]|uniref:Xanthine dehydrogenase family protein molybdopterin-binding subunit n=1 Tax=Roseomonas acroporae TaxID=2937791 RepID=A0A9X2BWL9_9PROT|nr:xanthine dehydrogenase family protein molybdopterin-binding subunit [Roseomonas acroporae]MCK8787827.1 xanthine dehydrogenase family protein molybdopterin-binding subunit [Roseomonas acroporae]
MDATQEGQAGQEHAGPGEGIGARARRKEDARHLHGRGCFTADIRMPGIQEVAFFRSPVAHARIRAREKPAALADSILFHDDLAGILPIVTRSTLPGYKLSEYPALAREKVRYVGEPVAICVAPTRAEAEDVAEQVSVEFEELPPVVSCAAGLAPGAALLHEQWGDNLFLETRSDNGIEAVAATAPVTVELALETARQTMHPMESRAILAFWDHRAGQLVVHMATQVPHLMRAGIAEFLGIPQAIVRVAPPDVGGGFGYKCVLMPEELAVAWLAWHRKAPFRWIEDRREHLVSGANTRQHEYRIRAYADRRGRLLGLDAEVTIDTGAYSVWPFTAGLEAAQAGGNLPGPYDLKAYRCHVRAVATNKPPFCPYRGVARPGVCFAIESVIDAVARAVGREGWEVRAENLVTAAAMPYTNVTGKHYDSGDYPASLDTARGMIGFEEFRAGPRRDARGRYLGIGFATYCEQTAHGTKVFASWGLPVVPGYDQAHVKLTPDGALEIKAGIHSFGQGLETTLAQVACTMTGVRLDDIRVTLGDTANTPFSTGAYASRGIVMVGGAVSRASEVVAARIKAIAAHLMQVRPEAVTFRDGRIHAGAASVSYAEVGHAWYTRPDQLPDGVDTGGLEVTEGYRPQVDTGLFSYGTHAARVAVDAETGQVEILDYCISEDCGRMVNPMIVEGQTFGGAGQGIGTALFEESPYDANGQPLASTLIDYLLPGPTEMPRFRIHHTETLSPYTAHGIKGVGEGGAIAPGAAIACAINDALAPLGAVLRALPASPERVLAAIAEAGGADAAPAVAA